MQTNVRHIFAVGDVTGPYQFTHMAGYQAGLVIGRSLFGNLFTKANYSAVPWVTYTTPELAQVGLNEQAAREKFGGNFKITRVNFSENDRAITEGSPQGFVKVMTTKKGRIVGATLVGEDAGELISLWAYAMAHGHTMRHITKFIAPYPTKAESAKRVASAFYQPTFYSNTTKGISHILFKLFG